MLCKYARKTDSRMLGSSSPRPATLCWRADMTVAGRFGTLIARLRLNWFVKTVSAMDIPRIAPNVWQNAINVVACGITSTSFRHSAWTATNIFWNVQPIPMPYNIWYPIIREVEVSGWIEDKRPAPTLDIIGPKTITCQYLPILLTKAPEIKVVKTTDKRKGRVSTPDWKGLLPLAWYLKGSWVGTR